MIQPVATGLEMCMKIELVIGDRTLPATLNASEAAKAFAAMLPLTLMLEDYAAVEKISDLPGKLSVHGAPDGFEPSAGDITYYAPWGNLAIFHQCARYAAGLVSLGKLDGDIEPLVRKGPLQVTFTRA